MIIGYNFFNKDFHGMIWDTAIPTSEQDELTMGAGIYDQIFVSVDTKIDNGSTGYEDTDRFSVPYPNMNLASDTKGFLNKNVAENLVSTSVTSPDSTTIKDGNETYLKFIKPANKSQDWFRAYLIRGTITPNFNDVKVQPNTDYTFSAYLKGTGTHQIIAYQDWTTPKNISKTVSLTDDWALYTFTVKTASTIPDKNVQFFIRSGTLNSEINVKKPKIEIGSVATPWMPSESEVTNAIKPDKWNKKNIMNAKFQNDLEAGSLDADGYVITKIQVYRRKYLLDKKWLLVGEFDFDRAYNTYSFIDRTVENDMTYEYSIVPIAKEVIGDITTSEPIKAEYDGVYISDLDNNYKMEIDLSLGEITYNKNSSTMNPINSKFPIVVYGNQNYKTSSVSFLSVTPEQIESGGGEISGRDERINRDGITNFLQKNGAKILRNSNGEVMIIAISNVKSTPKDGFLMDIHNVAFDYTQIGELENSALNNNGLVGSALKSNFTYDENGEIIWDI